LHSLSELSRSKAIKQEAQSLLISQNKYRPYTTNNGSVHYQCYYAKRFCEGCGVFEPSFFFKISFAERGLYYIMAGDTVILKSHKMARLEEFHLTFNCLAHFNAKEAIEGAGLILRRFNFKECELQEIEIDDNFLEYFEHVISTWSFAKIRIESCFLNLILSYSARKGFASLLLSAKPVEIEMYSCDYDENIDANFLLKYAQTAPMVELFVFDINEAVFAEYGEGTKWDPHDLLSSNDALPQFLPRFKDLHMHRLLVNTESLILALLDRRDLAISGEWEFRITRNFSEAEIDALMGPNHESYLDGDEYSWHNAETQGVRIDWIETGRVEDEDQNDDDEGQGEDDEEEDVEEDEEDDEPWSCIIGFVGCD
ncbi:hypothetical protein PENTCL1PPCAC_23993, partial [Pristionchus entomophagus]